MMVAKYRTTFSSTGGWTDGKLDERTLLLILASAGASGNFDELYEKGE